MSSFQESLPSQAGLTFKKSEHYLIYESSLPTDDTNGWINKLVKTYFRRPATSYAEDRASE